MSRADTSGLTDMAPSTTTSVYVPPRRGERRVLAEMGIDMRSSFSRINRTEGQGAESPLTAAFGAGSGAGALEMRTPALSQHGMAWPAMRSRVRSVRCHTHACIHPTRSSLRG